MRSALDRPLTRRGALYLAGFVAYLSLTRQTVMGAVLHPDFALYTRGGVHLYPSPLGTLIGSLGPAQLAIVNACSAGAAVAIVAYRARSRRAVLAALVTPVLPFYGVAGVDGIAALAVVLAWTSRRPGRWSILAALVHPASALFVVVRRGFRARIVVLAVVVAELVSTPYGGAGHAAAAGNGIAYALVDAAAVSVPLLLVCGLRLVRTPAAWFAIVAAALEVATTNHSQLRYFLPAVLVAGYSATVRPGMEALLNMQTARAHGPSAETHDGRTPRLGHTRA